MVATVAENLRRQNGAINENLLEQFRNAEENISGDAGTRAAFKQLQDIMNDRNDNSIESNKLAKQRLEFMEKQLKNNQNLKEEDKEYFQQLIRQSKMSADANLGLKKKAGELASVGLEKGIDSIGGAIAGTLSNSPLLAMGVSAIGGKLMEMRQQKKQNRAESEQKAKQAEDDALQEQREIDFLKTKIRNEDVLADAEKEAAFNALQTEEERALFLDRQKEAFVRQKKSEKLRSDAEVASAKEEKDLRDKFGISNVSPRSNDNDDGSLGVESEREEARASERANTAAEDGNLINVEKIEKKLDEIKNTLEYALIDNPPYLKHVTDGVENLVDIENDDSPSSIEIENKREETRHNKKLLSLLGAASGGSGLVGEKSKEDSGFMGTALASIASIGGMAAIGKIIMKFLPKMAAILGGAGMLGQIGGLFGINSDSLGDAKFSSDRAAAEKENAKRNQAQKNAKRSGKFGNMFKNAKGVAGNALSKAGPLARGALGLTASLPFTAAAAIMTPTQMADGTKPIDIGPDELAQIKENEKLISSENSKVKSTAVNNLNANTNAAPSLKPAVGVPPINPANTKLGGASKVLNKKLLTKSTGKAVGKLMTKQIPIIGAFAGAGFALDKLWKGDWAGGLTEAVGVAGPSLAGLPMDIAAMAQEVYNDMFGTDENPFPFARDFKSGSGGFKSAYDQIMTAVKDAYTTARDKLLNKGDEQAEKVATLKPRSKDTNQDAMTSTSGGRNAGSSPRVVPNNTDAGPSKKITSLVKMKSGGPMQSMTRDEINQGVEDGTITPFQSRKALKIISAKEDRDAVSPSNNQVVTKLNTANSLKDSALKKENQSTNAIAVANNGNTTMNNSGNTSVVNNTTKFDGVRNPDRSAQSVAYANGLGSNINW
tara:strand:- start:209 stop:2869 length:2661 start_codon:yes stop_codon:yes gene_type:complete